MGPTLHVGAAGAAGAVAAGAAVGAAAGAGSGAGGAGACAPAVKAIARAVAASVSSMRVEFIIIGAITPKVVLCCKSQNEFSMNASPQERNSHSSQGGPVVSD